MALGSVLKEFGVKISLAFDKKKVEEAKKSVNEIRKEMQGVALSVAAASAAMFEFANISSSNSRALQQNADMLGVNVERLQELEYAAKVVANVSRDELIGALEGVSNTLDKARHSDVMAAESLVRLGVPIQMITDRSITADQVMMNLADSFKNIRDPMAKARLAAEVFGGAGAKMLPLLNKGSQGIAAMGMEARSLGVVLSKEVIDKGAEMDRQFSKIWIVMKNITYLIGNELLKYLAPMVTEFQKFIVTNRQFISTGIATVMKSLGTYLQIVFKTVKLVSDRFVGLIQVLGGVGKVSSGIAITMGLITGLKIISAIGGLVKGFRALAGVLGIISAESLLIGAGLIALVLIVQDLFSNDSIIKQWIGMFAKEFPNATKLMTGSFSLISAVVGRIVEDFKGWFEIISDVIEAVVDFGEKSGIFSLIAKSVMDAVEAFKTLGGWIGAGVGKVGDFLGSAATAMAGGPAATGAAGNNQNSYQANITVQVPPGTSASAATAIVSGGTDDAFQSMLRQTRSQAVGGVAY